MLSIINHVPLSCCHDCTKIQNKAVNISPYIPWVDMAIGLILCILGGLASNGVIPLTAVGASCMVGIGSAQIILGLFMKCFPCCELSYRVIRTSIEEGNFSRISDIFQGTSVREEAIPE